MSSLAYTTMDLDQDELAGVEGYWRWRVRVEEPDPGAELTFTVEEIQTTGHLSSKWGRGFVPDREASDQLADQALHLMPEPLSTALKQYTRDIIELNDKDLRREILDCAVGWEADRRVDEVKEERHDQ
jgi:hypothetical protein